MHELSMAQAVLDAVRTESARHPGARVCKVGLRIGPLAGVDPDSLAFCFEALVKDSEFGALALDIERPGHTQACPKCGCTFAVSAYELQCPGCGEMQTQFAGGDELDITYLELEETEAPPETEATDAHG